MRRPRRTCEAVRMRSHLIFPIAIVGIVGGALGCQTPRRDVASSGAGRRPALVPRGVMLEDLTWLEAEKVLTPEAVVVLPIGAAAKEHGPHLKLKNDLLLA